MTKTPELPKIISILKNEEGPKFVVLEHAVYRKFILGLEIPVRIDEEHYMRAHPDVKVAIDSGSVRDASAHYRRYGYFENRKVKINARKDDSKSARRD